MAPSKKKNAYTYYIQERCQGTGLHYSQAFHLYGKDWQKMTAGEKEKYFKMVRAEGTLPETATLTVRGRKTPATITSAPSSSERPVSSGIALAKLTMADLNLQNVNHDVGEFLEVQGGPGQVKDIEGPFPEELTKIFSDAAALEFKDVSNCMLDLILVISCIPVSPMDQTLSPINRPLEIAVEGFKIGTGHSVGSLFHDFVDPGPLAAGSLLAVTEARRRYHQIPAASFIKSSDACRTFHQSHQLNKNYYGIYQNLLKVAKNGVRSRMLPFLTGDDAATTWACLTWLREKAMVQADHQGLPDLPSLILSTLADFFAEILRQLDLETLDNLQIVQNTYNQQRYHHQVNLRCPFHQEIESEICARGTANDKIFTTFDILRSLGFALPISGKFVPPASE